MVFAKQCMSSEADVSDSKKLEVAARQHLKLKSAKGDGWNRT